MPSYGYKKGTFSSLVQLEDGLRQIFIEAQRATLNKMKIKLEEFITQEVYSKSVSPNTGFNTEFSKDGFVEYKRTYDLYDIWNVERVYESHGKVYGSIEPTNYSALSHDKDKYQHTSPSSNSWSLTTSDYVHIINDGLDYSNSMFGYIPPRPFWDEFKKWAEENYSEIFKEECRARGLTMN